MFPLRRAHCGQRSKSTLRRLSNPFTTIAHLKSWRNACRWGFNGGLVTRSAWVTSGPHYYNLCYRQDKKKEHLTYSDTSTFQQWSFFFWNVTFKYLHPFNCTSLPFKTSWQYCKDKRCNLVSLTRTRVLCWQIWMTSSRCLKVTLRMKNHRIAVIENSLRNIRLAISERLAVLQGYMRGAGQPIFLYV